MTLKEAIDTGLRLAEAINNAWHWGLECDKARGDYDACRRQYLHYKQMEQDLHEQLRAAYRALHAR